MDERMDTALNETVTCRRVIAKGVAAGGLATLFAAVAAGRVLADDGSDTIPTVDDSPGTTPGQVDQVDTTPDDGETTNDSNFKGSKKHSRGQGRGK